MKIEGSKSYHNFRSWVQSGEKSHHTGWSMPAARNRGWGRTWAEGDGAASTSQVTWASFLLPHTLLLSIVSLRTLNTLWFPSSLVPPSFPCLLCASPTRMEAPWAQDVALFSSYLEQCLAWNRRSIQAGRQGRPSWRLSPIIPQHAKREPRPQGTKGGYN